MINGRFKITPKENIFWKEAKFFGKFIWNNKGKCLFIVVISIIVPFIPVGSAAAMPLIQKYRKLRQKKIPEIRTIDAKKLEPV